MIPNLYLENGWPWGSKLTTKTAQKQHLGSRHFLFLIHVDEAVAVTVGIAKQIGATKPRCWLLDLNKRITGCGFFNVYFFSWLPKKMHVNYTC